MHHLAEPDGYQPAPEAMRRVLNTPALPLVSLSPSGEHLLLLDRVTLPPIEDLAAPMLRLGGSRLNPDTNGPHGPRRITGYSLRHIDAKDPTRIALPPEANLGGPSWSADGSRFLFLNTRADGIDLYVCDVADPTPRLLARGVNSATGGSARWMPDQRHVLVRLVPEGRQPMPQRPRRPDGPVMQTSRGTAAPVRTYQDMLSDRYDERVFDWISHAQLVIIDTKDATSRPLGTPAIFSDATPSPDGRFLLVSRIVRPYSYLVPWTLFPEVVEIWDVQSGAVLHEVVRVGVRDTIPTMGVQTGVRDVEWAQAFDATLIWPEALDGGDPLAKVPHRDRVMMHAAPFVGAPSEITRLEHRYRGVSWLEAEDAGPARRCIATEYARETRRARVWLMSVDHAEHAPKIAGEPRLVFDRSVNDLYNDPGTPIADLTPKGASLVVVRNGHIFLRGDGATPEGNRPFLDALRLADLAPLRLWRNSGDAYERVADLMDDPSAPGAMRLFTSHERVDSPPNLRRRRLELAAALAAGCPDSSAFVGVSEPVALTAFLDPNPELRTISKRVMRYTRDDGTPLSATLYTPPGYAAGTRLPLVVWAYPNEVSDMATAGQVSDSPHRFTQLAGTSHLFLLLAGYAVMDDASMPVVGDPETVNDTFVTQILANARAAIDAAAAADVGDPARVAIAGHSYGAFMTANVLAHAPAGMLRAGIARSGAYNRTLTPFGFQAERRSFWEARDVYITLSPFTFAHQIKTPLLLIHGQIDSNSGTFPMQSERLYQAINGQGGTARLVMLPHEGHGYAARESVEHVLAEMTSWLDRYVKPQTLEAD